MSLWDNLVQLFRDNAPRFKNPTLDPSQVDTTYDANPITAGTAYCRLILVEMGLARGVDWFNARYPLVYSATRYTYGGDVVTIPYVTDVNFFASHTPDGLQNILRLNQPLTPLFPFNRGDIEIQAALFSLQASDPIGRFLTTLSRFSGLLGMKQLSSVIDVVQPLYESVEDLLGAGKSQFELGYQQLLTSAGSGGSSELRAGYFAVIRADQSQFDDKKLRVVNDNLRYVVDGRPPQPLDGYDYMLFRIERREEQDWESLTSVRDIVRKAQEAIFNGNVKAADDLKSAIRIAIYSSPDIAKNDRAGMVVRIETELKELGLQAAESTPRSLYDMMQKPTPEPDEEVRAELAELEILYPQ